jgi:hypothetical protein
MITQDSDCNITKVVAYPSLFSSLPHHSLLLLISPVCQPDNPDAEIKAAISTPSFLYATVKLIYSPHI